MRQGRALEKRKSKEVTMVMAGAPREKHVGVSGPNLWPAADAAVMQRWKPKLKTLEFDPMGIDEDDLLNLALEIFLEIGVHEGLGIETEKIKRFLLGVRDRMLENPFHNWAHVFDVTQTCYALVLLSKGREILTDMQLFGLMIATLCHDLEHPGVNNQFLVKSKSSLATLYNNESILEKHHAFRAFELMLHPGIDLLSAFSKDQYDAFRQLVMSLILATDMARHNEYVVNLKNHAKGEGVQGLDPLFYMEILLKCADISDALKPFDVTKNGHCESRMSFSCREIWRGLRAWMYRACATVHHRVGWPCKRA